MIFRCSKPHVCVCMCACFCNSVVVVVGGGGHLCSWPSLLVHRSPAMSPDLVAVQRAHQTDSEGGGTVAVHHQTPVQQREGTPFSLSSCGTNTPSLLTFLLHPSPHPLSSPYPLHIYLAFFFDQCTIHVHAYSLLNGTIHVHAYSLLNVHTSS